MKLLATSIALAISTAAIAEDPPVFRKGLWEFNRTVDVGGGQSRTMKKQNQMLTQAGCKSSGSRSGDQYSVSSDCVIQGVAMQSKSVITVESDSAYRIDVESQLGGKTTKELLVARLIGDC